MYQQRSQRPTGGRGCLEPLIDRRFPGRHEGPGTGRMLSSPARQTCSTHCGHRHGSMKGAADYGSGRVSLGYRSISHELEALPCVNWLSLCVSWCCLWASLCRTGVGNSEVTRPVTSTPTILDPISVNRVYRRRASNQQDGGSSVRMTCAIWIPVTAVPTSAPQPPRELPRVAGRSEVTGPVTSMPTTAARISVNRRRIPCGSDDDGRALESTLRET